VGLFVVAVVAMQFFVFDSLRLSIYFCPLAYIAFVVLLPMNMKPVAVLLLGFMTGVTVDFVEGAGGAHTVATLATAYTRRWMMIAVVGRETVEETPSMPSAKLLRTGKFVRYAALVAGVHCLIYFSVEALTWANYWLVLAKTAVSGTVTVGAIWACSVLFTVRNQKRR
jgi:hypothetical protein